MTFVAARRRRFPAAGRYAMTSPEPETETETEEVLTTPATPGAQALPTTDAEEADESDDASPR
jgi:hypothetical protein